MSPQLDSFFQAWAPPELRILGWRLRHPFCLGHSLLLESIDSPLAPFSSREVTEADLLTALRICAKSRWPYQPLSLKPTITDGLRLGWMRSKRGRFTQACEDFVKWRQLCSSPPEFWESADGGRAITAPITLSRASRLLMDTSLTEERVWSMSLGMLRWYIGAISEIENPDVRLFDEQQVEAASQLPDPNAYTEDELRALALKELGKEFAADWLQRRKDNEEIGGLN